MDWRRAQGIDDAETAVLFFGRLVREKGVEAFAATLSGLIRQGDKVRALIVGAGPAETVLRTIPGAIFTGHLDGQDLGRAVASADIMLNPSLTEAFGNVVLEGMASGLAVISPDTPSAAQLIRNQYTGILCAEPTPCAYSAAISALIAHPQRRHSLALAARRESMGRDWDAASRTAEIAYSLTLAKLAKQHQGARTGRSSQELSVK
jgi:glycosyltransferase involved in cell wall biosynthesis